MAARFSSRVLRWYDRHGRHDLPWQHPRTAYRIWLAEVMLQQTQVTTVIPYYRRFLARFPDFKSLARAPLDDVLALWSGLGYYARARNLHAAAQRIVREHGGRFPQDFAQALDLPGIGRSTAGAILAQGFGQRHAILDGNVKRLLARWTGTRGWPGDAVVQKKLWAAAECLLPQQRLADYTQAVMDLGATVCTARAPRCKSCPLRGDCVAHAKKLTEEIPAARLRKVRPLRRQHLLLIHDARGRLLLERRPERGLWGGLWCPPLNDSGRWPGAKKIADLPVLRHGFTHFDLDLYPVRMRGAPAMVGAGRRWITLAAAQRLGLPAPVRKILESP